MPNNSGDSFAESLYRKMSDDELQNTLRCEMFSEGALDNTQSEMILAEMERRRINEPTRSPEDAWAEFESDYSGRESAYSDFAAASVPPEKALHADKQRRKRCSKRKAILLASVICVLLASLMTVQEKQKNGAAWSLMGNGQKLMRNRICSLHHFRMRLIFMA